MAIPILGSVSIDADRKIQAPVDDLAGNFAARVDFAISLEQPPTGSHLWQIIGTVETPSTVESVTLPEGITVWVRVSGRLANGEPSSTYSTPVDLTVAQLPDFAALAMVLVDRVPVITWTPGALTEGVRIEWEVHDPEVDPGSLGNLYEVYAPEGTYTIALTMVPGEAITIAVSAWSEFSGAVGGDQGQTETVTLVQQPSAFVLPFVRTVEASSYTLALGDNWGHLRLVDGSGVTLTVPEDATAAFPIGSTVWIEQGGAGAVEVVPETSEPAVNSVGGMLTTEGQYAVATLRKVAADSWTVWGDLTS
jgi:hypothetical protein